MEYNLRHQATRRKIEDRIIREINKKTEFLDSQHNYSVNKARRNQLRAEAFTIPLEAFGFGKQKTLI